jgi:hypothetical protein
MIKKKYYMIHIFDASGKGLPWNEFSPISSGIMVCLW